VTGRLLGIALAAAMFAGAMAHAQGNADRDAVLGYLGRGTAAFRVGDSVTATREWSEAIRLSRQIGDADLEAQALARRGEAYRVAGFLNNAGDDLRAALAKAEATGDEALIAAASGALGNLELVSQHPEVAKTLLSRSRDLARRRGDSQLVASSSNDLGNLYAAAGQLAEAARAYADAGANAAAIGDPVLLATTVEAVPYRPRNALSPNEPSARPRPMRMCCTTHGSPPWRREVSADSMNVSAASTTPRDARTKLCFPRSKAPRPNCRSAGIGSRRGSPRSRANTIRR
jgi:tetratricopeptide (TPR) repeat protein